jgi:hypothetical protein
LLAITNLKVSTALITKLIVAPTSHMITAFIPFNPELATGALFILGAFGKVHERLILLWKVVDLSILFACEPFMRCTPAKQTVGLLA